MKQNCQYIAVWKRKYFQFKR